MKELKLGCKGRESLKHSLACILVECCMNSFFETVLHLYASFRHFLIILLKFSCLNLCNRNMVAAFVI